MHICPEPAPRRGPDADDVEVYCSAVDTWIWIVVAVLLIVLLLRVVGRRALMGRVDPTNLLLEPELVDQVRALARANQQVAAIKLLRERTPGLGLAPAKLIVDRMAAPKQAPPGFDGPLEGR